MLLALNCLNITMHWGIQCKWLEKSFSVGKKAKTKRNRKGKQKKGRTWLGNSDGSGNIQLFFD